MRGGEWTIKPRASRATHLFFDGVEWEMARSASMFVKMLEDEENQGRIIALSEIKCAA